MQEVSGDRSGAGGAWEAVEVGGGGGGVGNNCVIVLRVPCSQLLLADTSTHENTPRTSHQAHGKQAHIEHWHAHVTWLSTCKPETGKTDLPSPWRPRGDLGSRTGSPV
jgi:hypothetical protein